MISIIKHHQRHENKYICFVPCWFFPVALLRWRVPNNDNVVTVLRGGLRCQTINSIVTNDMTTLWLHVLVVLILLSFLQVVLSGACWILCQSRTKKVKSFCSWRLTKTSAKRRILCFASLVLVCQTAAQNNHHAPTVLCCVRVKVTH